MKVTKQETLYYEDHGATLKHKCGKRIVTLSLLSFSLIFWAFSFLWPFSLFLFLTWDNALKMMIITLLFFLQLNNYTSILRTKYDSMWMPPAVYRDMQWFMRDKYERIMNGGFATNTMSTRWSCKAIWQWWTCHDKRWKVAWQYISEWLWKCHNR